MNKQGQFRLLLGLFFGAFILLAFVALLPMIKQMVDIGTSSSAGLNCIGASDYNVTAGEANSIACLGLKLYLPLIVLVVLVAIIGYILYGDRAQSQMAYQ